MYTCLSMWLNRFRCSFLLCIIMNLIQCFFYFNRLTDIKVILVQRIAQAQTYIDLNSHTQIYQYLFVIMLFYDTNFSYRYSKTSVVTFHQMTRLLGKQASPPPYPTKGSFISFGFLSNRLGSPKRFQRNTIYRHIQTIKLI